jgi:hypothetical protein
MRLKDLLSLTPVLRISTMLQFNLGHFMAAQWRRFQAARQVLPPTADGASKSTTVKIDVPATPGGMSSAQFVVS